MRATIATLLFCRCARDEEPDMTTQESMFNFVRLSDGGIRRIPHSKSETHILADLASLVLDDSKVDFQSFKNFDSVREAIANIVPGMQKLKNISVAREEFHIANRLLHKPIFNTPSGKATFIKLSLKKPNEQNQFPFTLASVRSEGQFNSIIYETSDSYRGTKTRWVVLMNPADIKALGKNTGDKVTVKSSIGEMRDVTLHSFDVSQGNVLAYYPEANQLIGLERDPRSKTPAFKSVSVSVE